MENVSEFAILILSCDKYKDLWEPFMENFRRFFPVNDFPVYLGSNLIESEISGVKAVLSGDDIDWSTSYKRILEQIPEKKLFVILEDLFLSSDVNNEGFQAALYYLFEKDAKHVKYWANPNPFPDEVTENPWIIEYKQGAPYRATVCGFWDREYLMDLLIEGENPWNFEILGSYRTSYSDGFYGLIRPLCSYRNMVEKSCWIPQSVKWAKAEGVALEIDQRPLLKGGNKISSRLKMIYFDMVLHIPWRWRLALMNKLRRLLISY